MAQAMVPNPEKSNDAKLTAAKSTIDGVRCNFVGNKHIHMSTKCTCFNAIQSTLMS